MAETEQISIRLTGPEGNYESLSKVIGREQYLAAIKAKMQGLSQYVKKIKLMADPEYTKNQSRRYSKLLKSAKLKVAALIKKTILYCRNISVEEAESLDINNFESVSDSVDDLLERVLNSLDIMQGLKKDKKDAEIEEELTAFKQAPVVRNQRLKSQLDLSADLDEFDIDNSYFPFIPKIRSKPFAIMNTLEEIEEARELRRKNAEKFKSIKYADRKECVDAPLFKHPYKEEVSLFVNNLSQKFAHFDEFYKSQREEIQFDQIDLEQVLEANGRDSEVLKAKILETNHFHNYFVLNNTDKNYINNYDKESLLTFYEFKYLPLEKTPLNFVDTLDKFRNMISDLKQTTVQEIAVDLEHHSIESYLGLTCLMQISTRTEDYIVDTIKLRQHMQELNEIFTNPNITKVLHGADFDVEWLQKDFGLYLVNMFDTGQASRMLALPSFGLAHLLSNFCNVLVDKKYQLADWRLRPLSAELMKYAREDTHYLLYVYDCLKRSLMQRSLIKNDDPTGGLLITFRKSSELCLKQYVKPVVKTQEYFQILARNTSHLSKRQFSVLKLIYKFRDYVARIADLSQSHVLSNRNMFLLAKLPNYTLESFYLNLDKHSNFRQFVPDLIKMIEAKLQKAAKEIDKGNAYKLLEKSYIKNIKEKIYESKEIAKEKVRLMNVEKELRDKQKGIKGGNVIKNFKKFGEDVNFSEKKKSSFFSDVQLKEEQKENETQFEEIRQKFENFSVLAYFRDTNKIKNVEIVQPSKHEIQSMPTQDKRVKFAADIQISNQKVENYLGKKRKTSEEIMKSGNYVDLTSVSGFKQHKESASDNDEPNVEAEKTTKLSNDAKNMVESANFMKKLLKNTGKKSKGKKN